MKMRDGYCKVAICGVPYLLPYGQEIAAHAPNLRLNQTGEFLWDALTSGADPKVLPSLLMEEYDGTKEDLPRLTRDVEQFLCLLKRNGILLPDTLPESIPESSAPRFLQIGPLRLALYGGASLYDTYFSDFAAVSTTADQKIFLIPEKPARLSCGRILIRNEELIISETGESFFFFFTERYGIHEMRVSRDGARAELFYAPGHAAPENLFQALRFAFLVLAHRHGLYVVHSASLRYRDRAWLFSAPSGTGKSTHTNLWLQQFLVPLLNGDLNMLGFDEGIPTVYGIPWCGTSGIHDTGKYPLGGITFLKQAPCNKVLPLSPDEQVLNLAQRLISPTWTEKMLQQNLEFAKQLTPRIFTAKLLCTRSPEAAVVMKKAIDDFFENKE